MAHSYPVPQPIFSEPVFGNGGVRRDPSGFLVTHPSDEELYKKLEELLTEKVVGFETSRLPAHELFPLEKALGSLGAHVVEQIKQAGQIVFHAMGDSGAVNERKFANEIRVTDQLAQDARFSAGADRPAFLYHLGDVVYDFGESEYYYDQFYEPFRNYPAPIFAIPGNHDAFLIPNTPLDKAPLATFARNFCAERPEITNEARSLHRTAATQPGVYFTLDAPFVRIIGLFSNALEDPGLISSEGGRWRGVPDVQLDFLAAQLTRVRDDQYRGAVLLSVHHPPFTYGPPTDGSESGGNHGCSSAMLREIDRICGAQGVYPHAFLSAHAHNYQRYTRTVRMGGRKFDVPFVVCGTGGHNVNPLVRGGRGHHELVPHFRQRVDYLDVNPAIDTGGLLLEKFAYREYGYLRIEVDAEQLRIGFHQVTDQDFRQSRYDLVSVDLASHSKVAN
jgi:hypothetical protein